MSHTYRSMQKLQPIFMGCFRKIIGNGRDTDIWNDYWLNPNLRSRISGSLSKKDIGKIVANIIVTSQNGNFWNLNHISFILPTHLLWEINSLPLNFLTLYLKIKFWNLTNNGVFSSKTTYHYILNLTEKLDNNNRTNLKSYNWIWNQKAPIQEIFFLWQTKHKGLPTNSTLSKINPAHSISCPLCKNHDETHLHILRDCFITKNFWLSLCPLPCSFKMTLKSGLKSILLTTLLAYLAFLGTLFSSLH